MQGKSSKDRSVLFPSSFRGNLAQYIHYLRLFGISRLGFVFEDYSFCHSEIAFATNVTNDSNGDFRLFKARALSGRAGSPALGLMTHMPERTDDLPKMEMPNPACTSAWVVPPAASPTFNNQTLRQIVHTSIGGKQVRVRLSNLFGTGGRSIPNTWVFQPK